MSQNNPQGNPEDYTYRPGLCPQINPQGNSEDCSYTPEQNAQVDPQGNPQDYSYLAGQNLQINPSEGFQDGYSTNQTPYQAPYHASPFVPSQPQQAPRQNLRHAASQMTIQHILQAPEYDPSGIQNSVLDSFKNSVNQDYFTPPTNFSGTSGPGSGRQLQSHPFLSGRVVNRSPSGVAPQAQMLPPNMRRALSTMEMRGYQPHDIYQSSYPPPQNPNSLAMAGYESNSHGSQSESQHDDTFINSSINDYTSGSNQFPTQQPPYSSTWQTYLQVSPIHSFDSPPAPSSLPVWCTPVLFRVWSEQSGSQLDTIPPTQTAARSYSGGFNVLYNNPPTQPPALREALVALARNEYHRCCFITMTTNLTRAHEYVSRLAQYGHLIHITAINAVVLEQTRPGGLMQLDTELWALEQQVWVEGERGTVLFGGNVPENAVLTSFPVQEWQGNGEGFEVWVGALRELARQKLPTDVLERKFWDE